jgi:hypothetical protein
VALAKIGWAWLGGRLVPAYPTRQGSVDRSGLPSIELIRGVVLVFEMFRHATSSERALAKKRERFENGFNDAPQ